jgi:FkbH-like protein
MKLVDALRSLQAAAPGARPLPLHLVCGFTPLHLQTFVAAHLQARAPQRKVVPTSGLFGDCLGNLERVATLDNPPEATVVVLEWPDFDPRLGLRNVGGWRPSDLDDINRTVTSQVKRFAAAIARAGQRTPLRISLPSLPLPPVSYFPSARSGAFDLSLRAALLELGAQAALSPNVAIVNAQRLDRVSPIDQRRDIAAELASGFPYTLAHASALASALAELVLPAVPKKGIITDLDDTLWRGLVGEVGPAGVTWDLDHKSHMHALYQQLLVSLAEAGVLLAVASKNDPTVTAQAFEVRDELALLREPFFPMEVSWGPKSEAVGRILRAWNIGADSVVFIDDSPLELAEVQAAWPSVTCLRFPKESDAQVYALLEQLRDLFGKATLSTEDGIRRESLRQGAAFRQERAAEAADPEHFLSQVDAELTLSYGTQRVEPRALELLNKTNQFNLNGRRYSEGDWLAFLSDPKTFLITVAYKDKFGPLGTIGVIAGHLDQSTRELSVDAWVLSCRAFSRRIEHACLSAIFARFEAPVLRLDFQTTPKNSPLQAFICELLGSAPAGPVTVQRSAFEKACPPLYLRLKELSE